MYGSIVLDHFRKPRNQRTLADPKLIAEGNNPLCGDRVRIELRVADGVVREAAFTANACAICTAAASLLTEHVSGNTIEGALALADADALRWLGGEIPPMRANCATLPLRTLRQALASK